MWYHNLVLFRRCFQCTSLVSELEKFVRAVKDELNNEVQSLLLFPFEQATITDTKLR